MIVAAERGEDVLIARNSVPVARLVPYQPVQIKPPGAWRGLVPYATEWRSPETDQRVEQLFLGEPSAPPA